VIGTAVYALLNTGVASVGGRIHPKMLPQNTPYPALTYEIVSDPRGETHDGPDGRVEARLQVTAWAPSYAAVATASNEVREAMNGFVGVAGDIRIWRVGHVGGRDLYDHEVHVHHRPVDYLIQYTEG
jgi:hypothetical protein